MTTKAKPPAGTPAASPPAEPASPQAIEAEGKTLMMIIGAALAAAERQETRRGVSVEVYQKGLFFALNYLTASHGLHNGELTPEQLSQNMLGVARYIQANTPRKRK